VLNLATHSAIPPYRCIGDGDKALIFIHGFLDAGEIWVPVIHQLRTPQIRSVLFDLPGMGERYADAGVFTLRRFKDEVEAIIEAIDGRTVLIGHSMGTQIADLAAAAHPDRIDGLVLLAPVPLAGTNLTGDAIAPFKSLGGDVDAQRQIRKQLTAGLSGSAFDALVALGLRDRAEAISAFVDAWNTGDADGTKPSRFTGPTLVLRGAEDSFVTPDLVASGVLPRFSNVRASSIAQAGHWPHAEQPALVAGLLDEFLENLGWA
jgi:pimeloyl-ACP methyl ester carboxylesterase